MQCFRIMGLPDKIIAFDELPQELVKGFEMIKADGFPRYWKRWLGEKKIVTKIPDEIDPITKKKIEYQPFTEEDSYFYLVDSTIKPSLEQWRRVEEFVRNNVPSDFRLMDRLEDMAKPLAPDKVSGVTLEPEDVVVVPIPKGDIGEDGKITKSHDEYYTCPEKGCNVEFETKRAFRMHTLKKHKKEPVYLQNRERRKG